MSDALCKKCGEPWEIFYLTHEALWDHPGMHAPEHLIEAHHQLLVADDDAYAEGKSVPSDYHVKHGGEALTKSVMKGEGCLSCWHDPSRQRLNEDQQLEVLRHNLFDSNWDGDPAELF